MAAGIVELATGSDGAGSVRIPAAWCSVIGYKPTTALAPRTDPTGLAVPGVLVRDPRLLRHWAAAVLDDPLRATGTAAVAAWSADLGYAHPHLDGEVARIAHRAARRLVTRAGLGRSEAPVRLQDPERAWTRLRAPDPTPPERRAAATLQAANDDALAVLFDGVDLLMTPTTPGRPHGHDGPGNHMSVALTWEFNLSGHPAVSVPAGFTSDGAPVGLQLVTRPGADDTLLALLEHHVDVASTAPCAISGIHDAGPVHRRKSF